MKQSQQSGPGEAMPEFMDPNSKCPANGYFEEDPFAGGSSISSGHTLIAEQFNTHNRSAFERLAAANRLTEITFCKPNGRLDRLTVREAREHMDAGRNVYANVEVR
jgi:hypothetical protein